MGLEIEQLLSKVSFSFDFEMSQMFLWISAIGGYPYGRE